MSLAALSPLSETWNQLPYKDTGQLQGGQRNHQATLNNLQSDVYRSADQSQDIVQAARSYSGANTVNNLSQNEFIKQDGLAINDKKVNIAPPGPANVPSMFRFNYLQRVLTDYDAVDYLSRGVGNITQNQRIGQNALARLMDFDGNKSVSVNNLHQIEEADQNIEAHLDVLVDIKQNPTTYKNARFREIFADIHDQDAQAIMSTAQRQGFLTGVDQVNPSVQAGIADAGFATNNLTESATANQNNLVTLTGLVDLRRDPLPPLTPRSADIQVNMNGQGGTHRAVNSNSAVQEQALIQEASGGVEEEGTPTENGGSVDNNAFLDQYSKETSTVVHDITVLA